jgi:hypothetical protein
MLYRRPEIFVASSTKSAPVVKELAQALNRDAELNARVTPWNDPDLFKPGDTILGRLMEELPRFDFAIIVFGADDLLEGGQVAVPRDNVLFELGLFMGHLGPDRVYVLRPVHEEIQVKMLSDFGGLIDIPFVPSDDAQQLAINLERPANRIKDKIRSVLQDSTPKFSQPTSPGDIHELLPRLDEVIRRKLRRAPNARTEVRNIALDMEVTWGYVRDHYLNKTSVRGIRWRSLMIDAASPDILQMQSGTVSVGIARSQEQQILQSLPRMSSALRERFVDFEVRAYPSVPVLHGFLIDNDTLFLSFCSVERRTTASGEVRELIGSPNPYWCFESTSDNPSAAHFIQAFASWFDYLTGISRAVWPADAGKA